MQPLELEPGHLGRQLEQVRVAGARLNRTVYPAGYATPEHVHRLGNFCLTLRGRYEERWGDRWHAFDTATVLVKPPGVDHVDRFGPEPVTCLNVELEPSTWDDLCGDAFDAPCTLRDPKLQRIGYELELELTGPDRVSSIAAEGLLLSLVATTLRQQEPREERGPARWLDAVRERLQASYPRSLRLDDLAAEAGVCPSHLTRTFRKRFGCSIGDYVRRLRVAAALRGLADEDKTLAEVATEAGFSDQSHMGRALRRATGRTPAEYRAQLGRARRAARSTGSGTF